MHANNNVTAPATTNIARNPIKNPVVINTPAFVDTPFGTLATISDASELGGSLIPMLDETEGVVMGIDNLVAGVTAAVEKDSRNTSLI